MPGTLRLLALFFLFQSFSTFAQLGCPGCISQVNPAFPADTLYLQPIPAGVLGQPYDENISFRMPKTTTPVYAIDSVTPPNLTISKIEIVGVDGIPPGLFWQPNQTVFETATQTDGCIRMCGVPQVSDSFVLTVKLKATVFFITQETSFPMKMYIGPKVSITEGFTMQNFEGCAPLTTSFTNNVPSNGKPGYSYIWDFGDGTFSTSENPGTHTYTKGGLYPVRYQAIVDTNGFRLESITILDVDCVDQLGLGAPDLYAQIFSADGAKIFDSSPDVTDASLPLTLPVGIQLDNGNYNLKVIDEDSGLKGGDDDCGSFSFNLLSGDTIVAGGLTVVLNITHMADTIISLDTVLVIPVPEVPVFTNVNNQLCLVDPTLFPADSFLFQWNLGGQPLQDGREACYCATESGIYTLEVSNLDGCKSEYSLPILVDPNYDCTIGVQSLTAMPINIYPNPNTGRFYIRLDQALEGNAHCIVRDLSGRALLQMELGANQEVYHVALPESAPAGIYLIEIRDQGHLYLGKISLW